MGEWAEKGERKKKKNNHKAFEAAITASSMYNKNVNADKKVNRQERGKVVTVIERTKQIEFIKNTKTARWE